MKLYREVRLLECDFTAWLPGSEGRKMIGLKPYELPTEEEFMRALTYTQRITEGDKVTISPTQFKRTPQEVWQWLESKLKGER